MRIEIYFYIIISISILTLPLSTSLIIFLPVSIYLFIYLFIYLSIYFSVRAGDAMGHGAYDDYGGDNEVTGVWMIYFCLFVWLSVCLSVHLCVCVCVCLCVLLILFVFPSVCGYEFLWGNILIDCDWFEDYYSLNECYCTYCMFNHSLSAFTLPHSLCNSFWQYCLIFFFTSTDLW